MPGHDLNGDSAAAASQCLAHPGHAFPKTKLGQAGPAISSGLVQPVAMLSVRGGRPIELVEPRERGIEVGLVERLDAADQIAFNRVDIDHPPLGVEVVL